MTILGEFLDSLAIIFRKKLAKIEQDFGQFMILGHYDLNMGDFLP